MKILYLLGMLLCAPLIVCFSIIMALFISLVTVVGVYKCLCDGTKANIYGIFSVAKDREIFTYRNKEE